MTRLASIVCSLPIGVEVADARRAAGRGVVFDAVDERLADHAGAAPLGARRGSVAELVNFAPVGHPDPHHPQ